MEEIKENADAGENVSVSESYDGPVEWNFIDFTKSVRIFDVNPMMLKKFIGHNVTVVNTGQEEFHGCCLAIDPVSLSVLLARRTAERKIRIITLPGYHLSRIYINAASVSPEESVSVNDLDVAELYHAPDLYSEIKTDDSEIRESSPVKSDHEVLRTHSTVETTEDSNIVTLSKPELTAEFLDSRREELKNWLKKHHMPVTEKGVVLEMPGGIKILPPYTIESCDTKGNQIVKKKLGELINSMPRISP